MMLLQTCQSCAWGELRHQGGWERWWHRLRSCQRRKAPGQMKEILARGNVSGTPGLSSGFLQSNAGASQPSTLVGCLSGVLFTLMMWTLGPLSCTAVVDGAACVLFCWVGPEHRDSALTPADDHLIACSFPASCMNRQLLLGLLCVLLVVGKMICAHR